MTSNSHNLFLHIFTLFLYEYYLEEEREMALEKNLSRVVRRGDLPNKQDTGCSDGQRWSQPGPAGT